MLYSKLLINLVCHVQYYYYYYFFFFKGDPYSFWLLKTYNNVQVIIYGDTNE